MSGTYSATIIGDCSKSNFLRGYCGDTCLYTAAQEIIDKATSDFPERPEYFKIKISVQVEKIGPACKYSFPVDDTRKESSAIDPAPEVVDDVEF